MTRRVLVARADNVGDVVLAGPAVRAVASSGASVIFLASPQGAPAASLLPGVDHVVVARLGWIDAAPSQVDRTSVDRLVATLAAARLDEAVILTSFHQSPLPLAMVLRMAGVGRIAAISEDYPGSLLDVRHRVVDDLHEVERARSLVERLGFALPPGDAGGLALLPTSLPAGVELPPHPFVVVHPGASVPARAWHPEGFVALVSLLRLRGIEAVVTGGSDEAALTAYTSGGRFDLGGRTTLGELAAVLGSADAVVAGNTGPAHVAAAVGTPVVSLFAPTVPAERWRPYGVPHVLLGALGVPCAGCRARVCPVRGHPCLDDLAPEAVAAAAEALLRVEVQG